MERRHAPTLALCMLWLAAGIYYGAQSLMPSEGDEAETEVPLGPGDPPGLPVFRRVSADLFRGAQPSLTGFRTLKRMGVKTVVNLRHYHSDRYMLEKVPGLDYVHIDVKAWSLYPGHVAHFLAIATDRTRTPVFIHCNDGVGRTGVMCALYRIIVCGWSKDEARAEMLDIGVPDMPKAARKLRQRFEEMDPGQVRRLMSQYR